MSRLAFGPEPESMEVTDIATGHFVFAPVKGEKVSYELLERAITDAGYEIEESSIVVSGNLTEQRHLETPEGQTFHLAAMDEELKSRLLELEPRTGVTVQGSWEVREEVERIVIREVRDEVEERNEEGGSR